MPQLMELLTGAEIKKLYPAAEEAFMKAALIRDANPRSSEVSLYGLPGHQIAGDVKALEITEPILRWIHAIVWSQARPSKRAPGRYTHKASGLPNVKVMVSRMLEGAASEKQMSFAGQTISVVLRNNRILELARGSLAGEYWVRAWPEGEKLDTGLGSKNQSYWTMNDEQRLQDSIQRETVEKPQPVVVTFDHNNIEIPDPFTPQSAKAYILNLRKGYDSMRVKMAKAQEDAREAARKLQEAEDEIARLKSLSFVEWQQVGDELRGS